MLNRLETLINQTPDNTVEVKKNLLKAINTAGFPIVMRTLENYINIPSRPIDGGIVSVMLIFFNSYKKEGENHLTLDDFYTKPKKQTLAEELNLAKPGK